MTARAAPFAHTALLHHPQASHLVCLQGERVAYALHRSARRSLGFLVDAQGLTVRAPTRLALRPL